MRTDEILPDVALIYYLMFRGSVLPSTMETCIEMVRKGIPVSNLDLLQVADNQANALWDRAAAAS